MATTRGVEAGRAFVLIEAVDKTSKAIKKVSANLTNLGRQVQDLGKQFIFLGTAIAIPLISSINAAKNLSDELLALKAVLKADNNTIKDLEKTIRNLGKTTSFTSIQVAEAATNLARGGFSSAEIEGLST